jgi:DNA-binding transcriptional regulator LsrR (DeoR family)
MRTPAYSDQQLIMAARLYYLDNLPQADVAKMVNVSQAKVSRMLALARERGLVRITVQEYDPRDTGLERRLGQALDIEAIVIRASPGLHPAGLRQMVGYFAAPMVAGWLTAASVVGLAGGRTIQALVEHLNPLLRPQALELVQAMGTIDSSPAPYDAVELGSALARRWQGTFERLNTPAILPDADTCARLLGLEQIQHVMRRLAAADLILVGVGTLENSVFVERGVFGPQGLATLQRAGAVGEILGRFYTGAGEECRTPFREQVISLDLQRLREIRRRVAVVAGADRTQAILAAIRGGLLNTLVIDELGARALLAAA